MCISRVKLALIGRFTIDFTQKWSFNKLSTSDQEKKNNFLVSAACTKKGFKICQNGVNLFAVNYIRAEVKFQLYTASYFL